MTEATEIIQNGGDVKPESTIETGRNPDGTWKKGFCPNPGGRGKSPLKEFSLKEFNSWTDEKKREFLALISPFDRWRMTEGNPAQATDITSGGRPLKGLSDDELIDLANGSEEGIGQEGTGEEKPA